MFGQEVNNKLNLFIAGVKASFLNVKHDIDEVKRSVTDWILYLDGNQRELKVRVEELEKEVDQELGFMDNAMSKDGEEEESENTPFLCLFQWHQASSLPASWC